ncbi:hypothetical protein B0H17DRAFT_1150313 [Mycena rosella]|uniref:Uncharacterized protein n=1 Tax=Mycena rosella TaxID=1033263 RepID=A0AAD7BVD3_MYCRO|nr:hypothetical protein B0H17DRAFT_1150313 [Mycena rosella]
MFFVLFGILIVAAVSAAAQSLPSTWTGEEAVAAGLLNVIPGPPEGLPSVLPQGTQLFSNHTILWSNANASGTSFNPGFFGQNTFCVDLSLRDTSFNDVAQSFFFATDLSCDLFINAGCTGTGITNAPSGDFFALTGIFISKQKLVQICEYAPEEEPLFIDGKSLIDKIVELLTMKFGYAILAVTGTRPEMASDLTLHSTTGKVVTTVPKLLEGGTNWVSYKERMTATCLAALWNALCKRFENQGVLTETDLLLELTETRCTSEDPEDALKTIERLIKKRNEYMLAGGTLTDDVYAAILTKAMPKKQRPVIQTALTAAMAAGRDLDFALVHRTLEQSIKFEMADERCEREEAMAMAAKYQPQQQSKGKTSCTNCGLNNHTVEKCFRPGSGAEGQGPKWRKKNRGGKKGKAAASQESEAKPQQQQHAAEVTPTWRRRPRASRFVPTPARSPASSTLARPNTMTATSRTSSKSRCARRTKSKTVSGTEYATKRGTVRFPFEHILSSIVLDASHLPHEAAQTWPRLQQRGERAWHAHGYQDREVNPPDLRIPERNGMYPLTTWKPEPGTAAGAAHAARRPLTRTEAHERLGHLAPSTIEMLARDGTALNFNVDLSTPIVELTAKGGYKQYSTFFDDNTNIGFLYLQKTKEEKETLEQYLGVMAAAWPGKLALMILFTFFMVELRNGSFLKA